MELSSCLNSVNSLSKDIYNLSSNLFTSLSNDLAENLIVRLKELSSKIDSFLKSSNDHLKDREDKLKTTLELSQLVEGNVDPFQRTVKQLRMLGISTKVENARMQNVNADFNVLADNVESLSQIISDKAKTIIRRSHDLVKIITSSLAILENLDTKGEDTGLTLQKEISESITSLSDKYSTTLRKSEVLEDVSSNISKSINQIVCSIQVQDITRQQIEHIIEAFDDIKNSTDILSEDEYVRELTLIFELAKLQIAQLKNADLEFYSAVEEVISSLSLVNVEIENLVTEILFLVDLNNKGNNFLYKLEKEINKISLGIDKNRKSQEDLSAIFNTIFGTLSQLTGYTNDIDEVGNEIELIALNARIKAARVGNEGAALDVLAEAIQQLSATTKVNTTDLIEVIENIDSFFRNFSNDGSNEVILNISSSSKEQAGILLKELHALESETTDLINRINTQASSLRSYLTTAVNNLNIHLIFRNTVEEQIDHIKRCNDLIEEHTDNKYQVDVHQLFKKYTMHSERKVHNLVQNNDQQIQSGSDDELGDNIELF